MLLLFGLVVAPFLHQAGHGNAHHHGPPAPSQTPHGTGSVEHLDALVQPAAIPAPPRFVVVEVATAPQPDRESPLLVARVNVAQPQGP
jgi:hypothetical protein